MEEHQSAAELPLAEKTTTRIQSLDVLRGFALLGLPTMNIINFAMPVAAYVNPYAFASSDFLHDEIFIFLTIFADQKFMGLFTLLFGASLILLKDKNIESGASPAKRFYSRMVFLLIIGALHYWYIWFGDILMFYAIIGMFLYPLSSLSPKVLYGLSGLFFIATLSLLNISGVSEEKLGSDHMQAIQKFYQPTDEQITTNAELLLGSYSQAMLANRGESEADAPDPFETSTSEQTAVAISVFSSLTFFVILKMFAMITLGMALFKSRFLQGNLDASRYWQIGLISVGAGTVITIVSLVFNYANDWNIESYFEYGFLLKELGSIPMTIGYACLLIYLLKKGRLQLIFQLFKRVGRLALSNYLMQSVICMFVFYGIGLGLHGSVSRLELLPIIFGIWIIQIVFSIIWLHFFVQGPIEWLWRTCSTFSLQPLLRK